MRTVLPLALVLLAGCPSHARGDGGPPDRTVGDTACSVDGSSRYGSADAHVHGPCMENSDCPSRQWCLFAVSLACSATGFCMDLPACGGFTDPAPCDCPGGGPVDNVCPGNDGVAIGCGCNGRTLSIPCFLPAGFAPAPVVDSFHPCMDAGSDGGDAAHE